jgi:hypothetical protein
MIGYALQIPVNVFQCYESTYKTTPILLWEPLSGYVQVWEPLSGYVQVWEPLSGYVQVWEPLSGYVPEQIRLKLVPK